MHLGAFGARPCHDEMTKTVYLKKFELAQESSLEPLKLDAGSDMLKPVASLSRPILIGYISFEKLSFNLMKLLDSVGSVETEISSALSAFSGWLEDIMHHASSMHMHQAQGGRTEHKAFLATIIGLTPLLII